MDTILFGAAVSACEQGSQWQEALRIIHALPAAWGRRWCTFDMNRFRVPVGSNPSRAQLILITFMMDPKQALLGRSDLFFRWDPQEFPTRHRIEPPKSMASLSLSSIQHLAQDTLKPDTVLLNSAISACEKAEEWGFIFLSS